MIAAGQVVIAPVEAPVFAPDPFIMAPNQGPALAEQSLGELLALKAAAAKKSVMPDTQEAVSGLWRSPETTIGRLSMSGQNQSNNPSPPGSPSTPSAPGGSGRNNSGRVKSSANTGIIRNLESSALLRAEMMQMPILQELYSQYGKARPFDHIRVTLSQVLVPNSLPAVLCLLAGGATLIVTNCFPPALSKVAMQVLVDAGVDVELDSSKASGSDYYLDCGGSLAGCPTPRGIVEVTRTGYHRYLPIAEHTAIINVDDSKTKLIEDFYGTSAAFIRAIDHFIDDNIKYLSDKILAIIGFGKIGRGIAFRTKQIAKRIIVLDVNDEALRIAETNGLEGYKVSNDPSSNSSLLKAVDVVVSATGFAGVVTKHFRSADLKGKLLINMGAEDEFGDDYTEKDVFHSKQIAINFNLTPPTENKYIDAILSAQLEAFRFMIEHNLPNGIHPLPESVDTFILRKFRSLHGVSLSEINTYFRW